MTGDPYRQAAARIDRLAAAARRGARKGEASSAETFATTAASLAPVLTGALARSITPHDDGTVTIEGGEGQQQPSTYYDIVEAGGETAPGSHQAPQPYLRPAAATVAALVPLIARREVGRAIEAEARRMGGR